MESKQIIHVVADVILLAGVSFYFNGQIKSLKNEIKDLKLKIEEQTESYNKHLNNIYSLIDKLNHSSQQNQFRPNFTPVQVSREHGMGLRRRKSPHIEEEQPVPKQRPQERSHEGHARTHQPVAQTKEIDLSKELGAELQELQEEDEHAVDTSDIHKRSSNRDEEFEEESQLKGSQSSIHQDIDFSSVRSKKN